MGAHYTYYTNIYYTMYIRNNYLYLSKTLQHLPLFPNTNLTFPMFANNYLILAAVANKN